MRAHFYIGPMRRHDGISMIQCMFAFENGLEHVCRIGTKRPAALARSLTIVGPFKDRRRSVVGVPHDCGHDHAVGVGISRNCRNTGFSWCLDDEFRKDNVVYEVIGECVGVISENLLVAALGRQSPFFVCLFGSVCALARPGDEGNVLVLHHGFEEMPQLA